MGIDVVRKHASKCFSTLVFTLMSPLALALGLGEIKVQSYLNEPLVAEIPLIDLNGIEPGDIVVSLASDAAYEKEKLEIVGWINHIQFQVVTTNTKAIVKLSTQQPIKEPYGELLVQVAWPNGKLIREYAILLDPPGLSKPKAIFKEQLSTKSDNQNTSSPHQHATTQIYKNMAFGGKYGPVEDETLWAIAKELVKNTEYSIQQAVMAIAQKNQLAFTNGNINHIKKGAILSLPTQTEINHVTNDKAKYFVETQIQGGQPIPISSSSDKLILPPSSHDETQKALKLITPVEDNAQTNQSLLAPQEKNKTLTTTAPENVSQRLALVEETLDTLKRTNEAISQKNQHLQYQNESLAALLAAKDAEINRLKQTVDNNPLAKTNPIPEYQHQAVAIPDSKIAKKEAVPAPKHSQSGKEKSNPSEKEVTKTAGKNRDVVFILFMLAFMGSLLGWMWYSRHQLKMIGTRFRTFTKRFTEPTQPVLAAPNMDIANDAHNYGIQVDLEKALSAIESQGKKRIKAQGSLDLSEQEKEGLQKKSQTLLEDAEIYFAYERYQQAETILKEVLAIEKAKDPHYWEAYLKLLELYVLTEKYDEYKKSYAAIPSDLKEISPKIWSKVNLLQDKVMAEMAIHPHELKENLIEFAQPAMKGASLDPIELVQPQTQQKPIELVKQPIEKKKTAAIKDQKELTATSKLSLVKEDEIQAQISLARAYIEVGDKTSALDLLQKALTQATIDQKEQIQNLLSEINK